MARTQLRTTQFEDGTVGREDLNTETAGQAVIRKIIAGSGITLTYTGADSGTGDVTINAAGGQGGGSSGTVGTLDVDFGTALVRSKKFSLSVPGVQPSDIVLIVPSPVPASGSTRSFDELEMDSFTAAAHCPIADTLQVFINTTRGPVKGLYRFNYRIN